MSTIQVDRKFNFNTEKLADGSERKLKAITKKLSVISVATLAAILATPDEEHVNEKKLVLGAIEDIIYKQARQQINDYREANPDADSDAVAANAFDDAKLDFTFIANMPKAQRASTVPDDAVLAAFLDVFKTSGPGITQVEPKKLEAQITYGFKLSFKQHSKNFPVLHVFQDTLNAFIAGASEELVSEHEEAITYYSDRLAKLLDAEQKAPTTADAFV